MCARVCIFFSVVQPDTCDTASYVSNDANPFLIKALVDTRALVRTNMSFVICIILIGNVILRNGRLQRLAGKATPLFNYVFCQKRARVSVFPHILLLLQLSLFNR